MARKTKRTRRYTRRISVDEYRCEHCGEWFEARRSDAKYCATVCRMRAYRDRNREVSTKSGGRK